MMLEQLTRYVERTTMANDADWQRRTDEWVKATEKSRKEKESLIIRKMKKASKIKGKVKNSRTRP